MTSLDRLAYLLEREAEMLADLRAWVEVDCGTHNKAGVDQVGERVAARLEGAGARLERHPLATYGDCWTAVWTGRGQGDWLLIGHLDTVYADGTAAARPMRAEGDWIWGPGVCDMKGGLVVGVYALEALQALGQDTFGTVTFLLNSDEEVGSPASAALAARLAVAHQAAFVLEAARENGDIVSARKGSGEYRLEVQGRTAHAGVEPEKGANAIVELSHQIAQLTALNGLRPGVTVNVGRVGGGSVNNTVPDRAWVEVDVRAVDANGQRALETAFADWPATTQVPGTRVSVAGRFQYPPMLKTPAIADWVVRAQREAAALGFDLRDTATGGASDANLIAALGVSVLDGLGPVGGRDHSPDEYILRSSLALRAALLSGLLTSRSR